MNNSAREWDFTRAAALWRPMTKAVAHIGVPGYQWQAGVLWDGSLVIGPFKYGFWGSTFNATAFESEFAALGNNLLRLSPAFGAPPRFHDFRGTGTGSIRRSLDQGRLPIPRVRTFDGELVWDQTVFAHLLERPMHEGMDPRQDDVLLIHVRYDVANPSKSAQPARLWLHFGNLTETFFGYKVRGGDRPEPSHDMRFVDSVGRVDGKLRFVVQPPTAGAVRWHRTAPFDGAPEPLKCVMGWETELAAGQTARVEFILPYGLIDLAMAPRLLAVDGDAALAKVRDFWKGVIARDSRMATGDEFVDDYAAAVAANMAQQVGCRVKSGVWMYKTSPNNYENYWPCNAAKALPTFDLRGLEQYSRPVLASFLAAQSDDYGDLVKNMDPTFRGDTKVHGEGFARVPGFLGYLPGWTANTLLSSHGVILWSLASHFRITRDAVWLRAGTPSPLDGMLRGCDWLAVQRRRTMREENGRKVRHWGLLPAAAAHDWLSGNTIFNDAFCIYGMIEVVRLLREIGHERAEPLAAELADYRACLRQRYAEARDAARPLPLPDGRTIPFVPRDTSELDWATIDWTYAPWGPLRAGAWGALDPHDELVDQTLAFLAAGLPAADTSRRGVCMHFSPRTADENWSRFFGPAAGERLHLWPHHQDYETMWPQAPDLFLQRDDLDAYFEWFFNALSFVLHREWRVGVESLDGVPSCAPGDAERWRAIRNMFVNERGGYDGSGQSLWLLQAIPRCWLTAGREISAARMRTCFGGDVDLSLKVAPDGSSVSATVRLHLAVLPAGIRLRLRSADGRPLRSAAIDGAAAPILDGDTIALPLKTTGLYHITGRF